MILIIITGRRGAAPKAPAEWVPSSLGTRPPGKHICVCVCAWLYHGRVLVCLVMYVLPLQGNIYFGPE